MIKFYRRNFLEVEIGATVLASISFGLWCHYLSGAAWIDGILDGNRSAVYGALASIFGSLLGFVIAADSIVLGVFASGKLPILRQSKPYKDLWKIFTTATWAMALATVSSLIALIFDRDAAGRFWALYLAVLCVFPALWSLLRCIWVLEKIINLEVEEGASARAKTDAAHGVTEAPAP